MDARQRKQRKFVIAVVGDVAVGKTALIHQVSLFQCLAVLSDWNKFLRGEFLREHDHNETDLWTADITVHSESVNLFIIDTPSAPTVIRIDRIDGVIAVFSSASQRSFARVKAYSHWFNEVHRKGGLVALLGTHADIDRQEVCPDQVEDLAGETRARSFMLCTKAQDQARKPWDELLRQITWRAEPGPIETTSKGATSFFHHDDDCHSSGSILRAITGCFGYGKAD